MMTTNLHHPNRAVAHDREGIAWIDIQDEYGSGVSIFMDGPDNAARAAFIATAINAAIRPPVAAGDAA